MLDGFLKHFDKFLFAKPGVVNRVVLILREDVLLFQVEGSFQASAQAFQFDSMSPQLARQLKVFGVEIFRIGSASLDGSLEVSMKRRHQRVEPRFAQRKSVLSLSQLPPQIGAVQNDEQIAHGDSLTFRRVDTLDETGLVRTDRHSVGLNDSVRPVAEDAVPDDVKSGDQKPQQKHADDQPTLRPLRRRTGGRRSEVSCL